MADLLASIASSSSPPPAPTSVHADKLGLTASQVSHFLSEATAYAAGHGMLVQAPEQRYAPLPYCLLPVPFPRQQFELVRLLYLHRLGSLSQVLVDSQGIVLSPIFALLVDRVAADPDWLHEQLQNVLAEDAFTRRLVELSKAVQKEGVVQTAALGIHRSDYMLHDDPSNATSPQILQVELNTIAASFACMSSLASDLHRFLLERYEAQIPSAYYGNVGDLATHLPRNPALHALPAALARAHSHYGRPSCPNESNSVDQRWLEYTLWTAHKLATAELRGATRELWVDGVEVAVAYFRAGYTPTDYPRYDFVTESLSPKRHSETEWIGRTLVERSLAIKCPNIAYHLAGTKKVQQVLATPSELRRFLTEDQSVLVEKSFTGLFGLEQASPDLPREEVVEALATLTPAELESFILMERILPQEQPAVLVRNGAPVSGDTISELGMFSVALFDNGKAILNEHAGHLLRTKLSTTNEGGVAAGFAVLSSPFLV
ncbi:hypothetical protein DYB37_007151 [Aphanomyces astaci]|uniref:Glutathione synthetase n=1 Tax=Aphanomyces astaci TaxID=112090 RepID=A0A3R6Y2G8_APHAT|nr:hypothetical protein DYB37_007151 [Aphanomyces astaci]